ncbi:MAG: amino acid adenylation domain-containing protein, partial [Chloroflexota bacterium]
RGSFDVDVLQKVIQEATNRHEALRIVIDPDYEHQHILPYQKVAIPIIDTSHTTEVDQDHQIDEWLDTESQHQFNLTQGPLVRWHVLKRSPEDYMLVLTAHHIVLDGWSIVVLLREIGKHYQAMCKGQTIHFAPAMQWQEFAQQHADNLQSDQLQASQAYWLGFFNDTMPLLNLPTDRPRPILQTYNGACQNIQLGKVRRNHVKQFSQTFGCTPFMTLIAIYMLQLHRLSGQDDLIIGFPVAGRPLKGSEALLGYCSHLVVVRSQVQEDMDFATYLNTIRKNLLTAYEHQDYPFASLINKLNLPHDPSRSPLVTVTFNLERSINVADTFGMNVDFVPTPRRYAAFDVHLNITDINDNLVVDIEYNTDLFDATTIQRMLTQYQTLLDQVIDAPHESLNTYSPEASDTQITSPDSQVVFPELHLEPSSKQTILNNPTIEDIHALAPSQLHILFQDRATNVKNTYTAQSIINIDESLDQDAFTQAWHHIIARHSVLRTGFAWNNLDTPMQIVYRHAEIPINYIDLHHLSSSLREQQLAQHIETLRQDSGFDIAQPPLMDVTVFQLGQQQYRCVWTNHRIILDEWAKSLVLHEVYACYRAFTAHRIPELAPTPRYRHYIDWVQRQDMNAAEKYWRTLLSDFTTPNLIGTHHQREHSTNNNTIYHHKTQTLSQQETSTLHNWTHANQLTLSALVKGAWSLLLHRYTGDADVVFGNRVSGRSVQVSGIESMVGLLSNTLPVRTCLQPGISALEWIQKLQIQQDETLPYICSSLMKVQDWSDLPAGDMLFESVLVFENYPTVHDDVWTMHNCAPQHTGYPLQVMVESGTELQIRLIGRGDRFDTVSIERLQGHLTHLLTQMVSQPDCPVAYLTLLTPAEQHQLLVEWNTTTTPFPLQHTFLSHFLTQAQRTPTAIAVTDTTNSLSYAELAHQATHLATHLIQQGLRPEGVVALLAERDTTFLVAFLGILLAGGTYMPLDPQNPPARWHQLLGQSHAQFLLTTEAYTTTLQTDQDPAFTPYSILDLPTLGTIAQPASVDLPTLTPNLRAYILFTSGSTGQPKGAMLTHEGMLNHLFAKIQDLDLQHTDVVAQTAPQCFDISVWQFLAALLVGARVHILPDTIAHSLLTELPEHHITILETVPALLRTLLETTTTPSPSVGALRWLIPTGEALPPDVAQTWLARYPHVPLMNAYGPTECSDDVTHAILTTPEDIPDNTVPIGTPIANTQIYVLDSADMPLPIDVPGELWVGGTGVGRGYLYDPTRTAAIFRPDPFSTTPGARRYRTGDRARYRPDRQLEFLGRIDHQVKVRGFRIELGEIEAVIQQHPSVHVVVVTVWQGETDKDGRLVAYLVRVVGQTLPTVSMWRAYVGEHLPEYMVPAAYIELDTLPLTRNGKVDRRVLPEPVFEQTIEEYTGPRNETEAQLTHIWAEVLGLTRVGIHDNFFERGGNSLMATRFIARMPDHFRVDAPLRQIFLTPTIAAFAEVIEIDSPPEDTADTASQNLQTFDRGEKSLEDLLEEFQHLSEEEVLMLLAEMDEAETKS